MLNNAPITPFSKIQNTVKSATFESELVAMHIACDLIVAMLIKLKLFGSPIDGPCNGHCDNNVAFGNMSNQESTLVKKHNPMNYHIC